MEFLSKIISKNPDFASFLNDINKSRFPLALTGLSPIHKAILLCCLPLYEEKKYLRKMLVKVAE